MMFWIYTWNHDERFIHVMQLSHQQYHNCMELAYPDCSWVLVYVGY